MITTESSPTESTAAPAHAKRVVIADDEPGARTALAEMLAEEGFDVVGQAGDGEQVVAMAQALRPDLVIIDVELGKKDGIDAAGEITSEKIAPVVMISGDSHRDLVARARDAGAVGYLSKPLTRSSLLPAVEVAVARYAETTALRAQIEDAKHRLETRKVIDRAKGLLMAHRKMSEPEAFRWIQRTAMDRRATAASVAAAVVDEFVLQPVRRVAS
jgi:AmiR/NasT family two-component response regulator